MLAYAAKEAGVSAPLADATDAVNEATKVDLLRQVESRVAPGDTIAILGMAYKPRTYIVEESAGLFLAQNLQRRGHRVLVHDFIANAENSPSLVEFETLGELAALHKRDDIKLVVICCPWPEYRDAKFGPATAVLTPWKF